ncbi:hypothetical protein AMTR_s00089p00019960 [Amborella trichopoda]|uniref:Uncharacterized protein n=1 Tax=Amborella trichopoda TaxID=13333 RepID=W1NVZ8_AMBTC|nr:hypothetical protein AMTR_s00089p00019960 [Amborella trichopoda]
MKAPYDMCSSWGLNAGSTRTRPASPICMHDKPPFIKVSNAFTPLGQWEHGETSKPSHPVVNLTTTSNQILKGTAQGSASRSSASCLEDFSTGILGSYEPSGNVEHTLPLKLNPTVMLLSLPPEKPLSPSEDTPPKGMSVMPFRLSRAWGHIVVSMPSMEGKASNLPKTLFMATSPHIHPLLVIESSDFSSDELSSRSCNWIPSKREKRKVIQEKAKHLIEAMGVKYKGTLKVMEEALDAEEIEWPALLMPQWVRS